MNKYNCLAQNLKKYRELRRISMKAFAEELDMPLSTLRTILKDGNTTLHTAIHISQSLGVSLDMLVGSSCFSDKLFILDYMKKTCQWFSQLPPETRDDIAAHLVSIWKALEQRENDEDREG